MRTEADETDAVFQIRMHYQLIRQNNPPFAVGLQLRDFTVEREREIFLIVAECGHMPHRFGECVERRDRPALDTIVLVRRTQDEACVSVGIFERNTKRRGNGDAPFGIQPIRVGAQELGHPAGSACLAVLRLPRSAARSC